MRVIPVRDLQTFLRAQGFTDIVIDGVLGPTTQNAFLIWAAGVAAPGVSVSVHQEADYAVIQPESLADVIAHPDVAAAALPAATPPGVAQAGVGTGTLLLVFGAALGLGYWVWR